MTVPVTSDAERPHLTLLEPPDSLKRTIPAAPAARAAVQAARSAARAILRGTDDRLLVAVGPCSIHDPEAALEYAALIQAARQELGDRLEIVMRAYFAKPRTTVGWKGLLHDPNLDGTSDINLGLAKARKLLAQIAEMGVPAGTEYLDTIAPAYLDDLISWAAIGARTTESQVHRELASAAACPIGFKNGTSGDVQIALDAVVAAASRHHVVSLAGDGRAMVTETQGNRDCHLILRGGRQPNYDAASVDAACQAAEAIGRPGVVMIDASHGNSLKKPENQPRVAAAVAEQIGGGDRRIIGIMIESNLVAGNQSIDARPLRYGQSVTDGCVDWPTTGAMLRNLADAVSARRRCGQRLAG
ncbi:MAG: 3-deoxy-7-phosphoheptulonate synthase [Alphaproteobacteria bacterium]|nr:3-deoxy-7-phosphoheptulonate synthase [Alphaproteobacteria bacterium]MCB9930341.1 3-deoxy-7-phosphoheptulonate synthase [Alphaproteobacteria bacterium]